MARAAPGFFSYRVPLSHPHTLIIRTHYLRESLIAQRIFEERKIIHLYIVIILMLYVQREIIITRACVCLVRPLSSSTIIPPSFFVLSLQFCARRILITARIEENEQRKLYIYNDRSIARKSVRRAGGRRRTTYISYKAKWRIMIIIIIIII